MMSLQNASVLVENCFIKNDQGFPNNAANGKLPTLLPNVLPTYLHRGNLYRILQQIIAYIATSQLSFSFVSNIEHSV